MNTIITENTPILHLANTPSNKLSNLSLLLNAIDYDNKYSNIITLGKNAASTLKIVENTPFPYCEKYRKYCQNIIRLLVIYINLLSPESMYFGKKDFFYGFYFIE